MRQNWECNSESSAGYPKRERRAPHYYTDYDYKVKCDEDEDLTVTNIDDCYHVTCDVPKTLKEALSSSKSEQWAKAMREETDSLTENDAFTLTTVTEDKHAVGG